MTAGPGGLSVSRLLSGVGAYFDLMGTSERLLYVDYVRYVWLRVIHGSSVESVWRIDQVFPYRVYIDSNRRDFCI
jgi:hypothetical protein